MIIDKLMTIQPIATVPAQDTPDCGTKKEKFPSIILLVKIDQIVLAQDAFDLEYMMRKFRQLYSQLGLQVNFNKTQYVAMNSESPRDLLIDGIMM
jgi:hypothetical protein